MTTTLLWLVACGPALIGLLSRRLWVAALLIALDAAVLALIVWAAPDVALVALFALYVLAVMLVIIARRRVRSAADEAVERERLAALRRVQEQQNPWSF